MIMLNSAIFGKTLMLRRLYTKFKIYVDEVRQIDLLDFNRFIFKHILLKLLKTENIIPFLAAVTVIGFSIVIEESQFIFIPQTSVAAFASFFIFSIIVSIIILVIYPLFILFLVNFLTAHIKNQTYAKLLLKLSILFLAYGLGVVAFTNHNVSTSEKFQLVLIWVGLYYVLTGLYLTHLKHNTLSKLTKTKIIFILIVTITMSRPLLFIFMHISEALNVTSINSQIYLTASNCQLLTNLDGHNKVTESNNILYNREYFQLLPDNQGCYIYANTIRDGFAYDFVLLVKKNIQPLVSPHGIKYNEYIRLSCYAGNCYSENHIFYRDKDDLYKTLIEKGAKYDKPL